MVLNQHFPYGFKLNSVRDLIRFRRFADADAINCIPEDDDELKSMILSIGTFIGDRLYAKSDILPQELCNMVRDIFADRTAVIYYEALIEHHSDWMNEQHITSEEILKELLQKYFPNCYYAKRFIINGIKQTEKEIVSSELKRVWGNSATKFVEDLSAELPYIPTEKFGEQYLVVSIFQECQKAYIS